MSGPLPRPEPPPAATLGGRDLPEAARERLRATAQTWTSDLSVAELAAVRRAGFEPAGMVVGMTCYQIALQGYGGTLYGGGGWMGQSYGFSGYNRSYPCPHVMPQHPFGMNFEDTLYERAVVEAYGLALSRLMAEAAELGAHGVVGVRHTVQPMALSTQAPVVELKMIGTAIRRPGADPLPSPFTSHLSGQDFLKLLTLGWVPVRLAVGVGIVRSVGGCVGTWGSNPLTGGEFVQRSDAVQECRALAVQDLERAAHGAERVVGVVVSATNRDIGAETMLCVLTAVGPALRRFRDVAEPEPPAMLLRLVDA